MIIPVYRLDLVPDGVINVPAELALVKSSAVAAKLLRHSIRQWQAEEFWAFYLGPRGDLRFARSIGAGEKHAVRLNMRELLLPCVALDCASLLIGHSHTTSPIVPSLEDRESTWQVYGAAELIGARLVDHVIVNRETHFSFMDATLLR